MTTNDTIDRWVDEQLEKAPKPSEALLRRVSLVLFADDDGRPAYRDPTGDRAVRNVIRGGGR